MTSAVCTLFEGHYHYGVAALVNSLYNNGFRGAVYVGYRGELPFWSANAKTNDQLNWPGSSTLLLAEGLQINFLPVNTDFHFTNYKPTFMLNVIEGPAKDVDNIAYFDPDIVNKSNWEFYNNWMSNGVAVIHEITSNDMPATHPIRLQWKRLLLSLNRKPENNITSYLNAGFCGLPIKHKSFLQLWQQLINYVIDNYKADKTKFTSGDRTHPFFFIDQDPFNAAAMDAENPISEMGPEAMDFVHGGYTMSHAVGAPKPWKKKFIISALKANAPGQTDKLYWNNVTTPIALYSPFQLRLKKSSIAIGAIIGRFYRRR